MGLSGACQFSCSSCRVSAPASTCTGRGRVLEPGGHRGLPRPGRGHPGGGADGRPDRHRPLAGRRAPDRRAALHARGQRQYFVSVSISASTKSKKSPEPRPFLDQGTTQQCPRKNITRSGIPRLARKGKGTGPARRSSTRTCRSRGRPGAGSACRGTGGASAP